MTLLPIDHDPNNELARFVVPSAAAEVLDLRAIVGAAYLETRHPTWVEVVTKNAGAGKVRIACRVRMALRLVNAWYELHGRTPTHEQGVELRTRLELAIEAAHEGIVCAATRSISHRPAEGSATVD